MNGTRALIAALACCLSLFPSAGLRAAPDPNQSPQQPVLSDSGEIRGAVNYCGTQGSYGIVIYLAGRSFVVTTDASGQFVFNYVPAGTYTMIIQVPGQAPVSQAVQVAKNKTTQLGTMQICPDNDHDGYAVNVDCNDNNPSVHPGATEQCDGIDNTCDGRVDEGCATCTDADHDSYFAQSGCGTPVDCNDSVATIHPAANELCDGVDNNCSGATDENFNLSTDPNNCGTCGTICASGVCSNGVCTPPSCDDGNACTNDSFNPQTQACSNVPVPNGTSCGNGLSCQNGQCVAACTPSAEVCDGMDNNCNGTIDEGNPGGGLSCLVTGQQGVCSAGTTTCQNGALQCMQTVQPSAELCDGRDNNCNGIIDEGNPGGGAACNTGQLGACAVGTTACQNGALQCMQTVQPSTEVCDFVDNDCDGQVNEGGVCN